METIAQIWIFIFGCSAIWVVGRLETWRRWGCVLGLMSQPAWFYTAWQNEQWGIVILACFYTYSWAQGAWNHWGGDR